ncbi:ammonium transporter [Ferroplasma sp.]|uniref:ammonium transporter n=1 Tax=Ferroplasma sp. TaxID=2591003 RepID=UPI00307F1DB8
MEAQYLINNLWVIIAALLVFTMTISVGFLEIGEMGKGYKRALIKTVMITGLSLVVMAVIGFNTAFAPTLYGVIGNPLYSKGLLLGSYSGVSFNGVWWSMKPNYFNTGLTEYTYFLFETAFASVTLALVGLVVLKKMKLLPFFIFAIIYFIIIWNLPAAWIWNPTGWLYEIGMRDFAGGLVVHGAAGAAGLAIMVRIYIEERKKKINSNKSALKINHTWLTLSILLLLVGWFGFNPGSVLAFNTEAMNVAVVTFLAAGSAMLSTALFVWLINKKDPAIGDFVNGILMGLIIITPLAGFVSAGSAIILGIIGGPLLIFSENMLQKVKWLDDPMGLMPGHAVGGLFGIIMIGFFTQHAFAIASGDPTIPSGIFFNGGMSALHQLGIELFGIVVVMVTVFAISYAVLSAISKITHGIIETENKDE